MSRDRAWRMRFSPNLRTPIIGTVRHFPENKALLGGRFRISLAQPAAKIRKCEFDIRASVNATAAVSAEHTLLKISTGARLGDAAG
jgi:hypothetical protein